MLSHLTLPSAVGNLDAALRFVEECAETAGVVTARIVGLTVAVEEAFVNVCNYAYTDTEGTILLTCGMTTDGFVVEVSDEGTAFDVLSLADPDTTQGLDEREVGGLGIYLIRQFTDEVTYRREEGRNILRLLLHPRQSDETQSHEFDQ